MIYDCNMINVDPAFQKLLAATISRDIVKEGGKT